LKEEARDATVEPKTEDLGQMFVGIAALVLTSSLLLLEMPLLLFLEASSVSLDLVASFFLGLDSSFFVPGHGAEVGERPADPGVALDDENPMACLERVFEGLFGEPDEFLAQCRELQRELKSTAYLQEEAITVAALSVETS
jgi:hypothetical protein